MSVSTQTPEVQTKPRSLWIVVLVSALTSISVWGIAELIQHQMKPEPPPPTITEQFMDGLGGMFEVVTDLGGSDLEALGNLANLFGGDDGNPLSELEGVLQLAESAMEGLSGLGELSSGSLEGLGELGNLDVLMEDAMKQVGDLFGEDLMGGLGDLSSGLGDLGGLLGGGEEAATEAWELSPEEENFGGLDALDKHLEDQ